ncbi:amylosucrase [Aquirufa ecclesiirivi]|uniref:amylosucrase n=1 Tax=Aquirufa ecclesiirivi TaxID=2715124 RepID=UPI0023D886D6|nr:amylosucrase [Aquirufa ecclesiirivi]MDF0694223.1 amylosucrase [Aquirufa ecclesiirivi]
MYNPTLQPFIDSIIASKKFKNSNQDQYFLHRLIANIDDIHALYARIYGHLPQAKDLFGQLIQVLFQAHLDRSPALKNRDEIKEKKGQWFLSNELTGMSLYVDRFAGNIEGLANKLPYLEDLGVNLLHLMPLFKSPEGESDGGYAVEDFRVIEEKLGTIEDLKKLQTQLLEKDMYLMIDIVLNHTSHHHEWAKKAKAGNPDFQEYYYFYDDRSIPDQMEENMPEIFPESSPGSFTFQESVQKWVMTVFHQYQWDLNYQNPKVLIEMLDNLLFYGNLGVDIVRIDAPAFIWKQLGTTCQNLPEAHALLQLIKLCTEVSTPGMAILGEAIVAPAQIMEYFGKGRYTMHECDFAYNATHMALQWDALATGDTRIMLEAQHELAKKPLGSSWITYTRCHDDIGLGYDDYMIANVGFTPYLHRYYLKNYYGGIQEDSPAAGALFAINPKTQDARISGSLASLCGLEKALAAKDPKWIEESIQKILLMEAHSLFLGGIPMLFYGDEAAYTNDYSYLKDPGKSYDNRWMHRPIIHWEKNALVKKKGTVEHKVYTSLKELIALRKKLKVVADLKNLAWLPCSNKSIVGYVRYIGNERIYFLFNFSSLEQNIPVHAIEPNKQNKNCLWSKKQVSLEKGSLLFQPYQFYILADS